SPRARAELTPARDAPAPPTASSSATRTFEAWSVLQLTARMVLKRAASAGAEVQALDGISPLGHKATLLGVQYPPEEPFQRAFTLDRGTQRLHDLPSLVLARQVVVDLRVQLVRV